MPAGMQKSVAARGKGGVVSSLSLGNAGLVMAIIVIGLVLQSYGRNKVRDEILEDKQMVLTWPARCFLTIPLVTVCP